MAISALTITDRLAIRIYANVDTKTVTLHTENSHLCQVVTTFSKGLTSLNNLTAQVQYLATGTSGTDFAISSSTATHTFNLPVASATNTGKLSSTDWATFNAKANDSLVVHLAGTETISGTKTFTNSNVFSGANLFTTWSMRFDQGTAIKETANFGSTLGYTTIGGAVNGLALKLSDDGKKTFAFANATTNNTYTFPDATGTVALTSDISYPVSSVFGRTGAVVATEGDYSLTQLSDVTITTPSTGQVLKYNGTDWVNDSDTDTGITSLNGLTATTQTFAVGTSGTDFNISSATATHTFNLPTASAANRGALSSSDWTNFNNKQSTLSLTTTGNSGSATLVSNTLNVPTYTLAGLGGISLTSLSATTPLSYNNTTGAFSIQVANTSQDGYLSSTDWNTFNGKQNTITNPVTGTGTSGQVTYFNGTSSVTGSSSFKFDGTNLTIGNPSSALAQLHIYNASAAASFLLQTDSTTDYSEIAVRNNSSTATSYFRQYSTAATGSDFGISRAGLALFFSNYATNFAIGTRNGGDLILGTADTERARVLSSNGYFGLGTSTPSYLLDVNGTGRFSDNLTMTIASGTKSIGFGGNTIAAAANALIYSDTNYLVLNSKAGSALYLNFDNVNASSTINMFNGKFILTQAGAATFSSSVTAGGNIIIPTTYGFNNNIYYSSGYKYLDNGYGFNILNDGSGNVIINQFANNTSGAGAAATALPRLTIASTGNVGIGTSSPIFSAFAQLTVNGTQGGIAIQGSASGFSRLFFAKDDTSNVEGLIRYAHTDNSMQFFTAATERMRITSGGYLKVSNNGSYLGSTGTYHELRNNTSGTATVVISNTNASFVDNVLAIGSSKGSATDFNQIAAYTSDFSNIVFKVRGDGNCYNVNGVYTSGVSDIKYKEQIVDTNSQWDDIKNLRVVNFKFIKDVEENGNNALRHIGFIAQEVEKVSPNLVEVMTDNVTGETWKTIKTSIIHTKAIKALQECMSKIEEQQQQIEELKLKIK